MRRGVGAVLGAVLLAGCAPTTVTGSATAPSSTGLAPVSVISFDPCAVADTVVVSLKMDPATKKTYNDDFQQGVETGCAWKDSSLNSTVGVDIGRTTRTRQEYLDNTAFNEIAPTVVGSHRAVQFSLSDPKQTWSIAIEVPHGVVILSSSTSSPAVDTPAPDAKVEAERMAAVIEPLLPS